jgi:hypothetical protein
MFGLVARMRRHLRQRTRGQSFVEFALVLPIFLVFLAATLDLGRVFYANITLHNAAREGAFQASKTPQSYDDDQPCDQAANRVVCRIQNESKGSMVAIQPDDIDMVCNPVGCPEAPGATVTVNVRGQFRLITPILSFVFGGQDLQLASSATAQIEYFPDINLITPPPGPVAQFTASATTVDTGDPIDFDSTSSTGDPTDFQWDFNGDGVIDSTEANPSYAYTTAGTYTVTLTVINLTDVDVEQKTGYITVTSGGGPLPSASSAPPCVYPPNVVGQSLSAAQLAITTAGFPMPTVTNVSSGSKGKVHGQFPDHTECISQTTVIDLVYRPPS